MRFVVHGFVYWPSASIIVRFSWLSIAKVMKDIAVPPIKRILWSCPGYTLMISGVHDLSVALLYDALPDLPLMQIELGSPAQTNGLANKPFSIVVIFLVEVREH
jgi:hypothetical protein